MTLTCPACSYGFMRRIGGRCPRCQAVLVKEGESFIREDGDRVYLWIDNERRWSEVLLPA